MMESNLNLSAEGKKNGNLMNRSNPDVNKGTKKKKKSRSINQLMHELGIHDR